MSASRLAVVASNDPKAAVVDEFGELDRRIQEFEPVRKRHEQLKSEIKSWYEEHPPGQPALAEGLRYTIQVSAKATVRTWASMERLSKALGGWKRIGEICSVAISAVQEQLGKEKTDALLIEDLTGARRLKCVPKAYEEAA